MPNLSQRLYKSSYLICLGVSYRETRYRLTSDLVKVYQDVVSDIILRLSGLLILLPFQLPSMLRNKGIAVSLRATKNTGGQ